MKKNKEKPIILVPHKGKFCQFGTIKEAIEFIEKLYRTEVIKKVDVDVEKLLKSGHQFKRDEKKDLSYL